MRNLKQIFAGYACGGAARDEIRGKRLGWGLPFGIRMEDVSAWGEKQGLQTDALAQHSCKFPLWGDPVFKGGADDVKEL